MGQPRLQCFHHPVDAGKHIAFVNRFERALPLQPQFGRNENERRHRRHRRRCRQHRPWQIAGREQHPRPPHHVEQAEQWQTGVLQGIGQRPPPMIGHQLHAGPAASFECAGGKPFRNEHSHRLLSGAGGRLGPRHRHGIDPARLHHRRGARLLQGDDRQSSGVRFVDVMFQFLLDLRG